MNRCTFLLSLCLAAVFSTAVNAAALGTDFTYQGVLTDAGTPVNELADMRFSLWDASAAGSQIGTTVEFSFEAVAIGPPVNVADGLFTVDLDFGVTPFDGADVFLEIEVRVPSGPAGSWTVLSPRQRIAPTPYALQTRGMYVDPGLNVGVGTTSPVERLHVDGKIRLDGSGFNTVMIDPDEDNNPGNGLAQGVLSIRSAGPVEPGGRINVQNNDGDDAITLVGGPSGSGGTMVFKNNHSTNPVDTVVIQGDYFDSGRMTMSSSNFVGVTGVTLEAAHNTVGGGYLELHNFQDIATVELDSGWDTGSAALRLKRFAGTDSFDLDTSQDRFQMFDAAGHANVSLLADANGGGGFFALRNSNPNPPNTSIETVQIDADEVANNASIKLRYDDGAGNTGPAITMLAADTAGPPIGAPLITMFDFGTETVRLDARGMGGGGGINLFSPFHDEIIELDAVDEQSGGGGALRIADDIGATNIEMVAMETNTTGAAIKLRDSAGNTTILLDAEFGGGGDGRIRTEVLEITGGSDLSEQFDVAESTLGSAEPGMVVSIDEVNPGRLIVSSSAYDRKVAGVVSGANGVKTGLYMRQKGSEADGMLPIALTGRVYCLADASHGAIRPGDLLTTSDRPGHAMKVIDHVAAQGAIIGKAMSNLEHGEKGLVLVLVNLQ